MADDDQPGPESVGFEAAAMLYTAMVRGRGTLDADAIELAAQVVASPQTAAEVLVHVAGLACAATAAATPPGGSTLDTAAAVVVTVARHLERASALEPAQLEGASSNVVNFADHRIDRGARAREHPSGMAGRRRVRGT